MAWVNGIRVDSWAEHMADHQHRAFDDAQQLWEFLGHGEGRTRSILSCSPDGLLVPIHPRHGGARCDAVQQYSRLGGVGSRCMSASGAGLAHVGIGPCRRHYGRGANWDQPPLRMANGSKPAKLGVPYERALWSWVMAHAYAQARETTPWQALLDEVKALAGQRAWLDERLLEEEKRGGADALRPGGTGWDWVQMRDARGDRLAKVSKMAIDAGVAQFMLEQVRAQGELLFRACTLAAKELELPEADQLKLVTALARKLTELESAQEAGQ